jgi:hypothetical protein|eukprot:COSAG06_NODE_594_length_13939_cov_45.080202_11_plen_95_part_00
MSRDCVGVGDSCAQPHGSGGGGAEARGSVVAKADARNVRSAPGGGSALMISSDLVLSGLVFCVNCTQVEGDGGGAARNPRHGAAGKPRVLRAPR